tara:strand:+ start:202 stop:552 length:351 start_codon:yes stop_codon:yes gene_type:complete
MSKFKGGDENINRNGRPVGSQNNATKLMKQAFAMLVENNLPNMETWLIEIAANDPAKAMDIIIRLSERFVPALARTELTAADGQDIFKSLKFGFGPAIDSPERIQELEESDYDNEV